MERGERLDPAPWALAWERIDTDFEGHLEEIVRFLRRPTVSASDDDMLAGAEHVAALIEGAGGRAEIVATNGHPAVIGRIEGDGPRLLRYGMYDVQPADEPGWSSPPFADRVAIMYLGKIVELGPTETVLTDPLHPYTRSLLTVTPEVGRRQAQHVLTGEPPDPAHIPPGCRFHPRCPVLQSGEAHVAAARDLLPARRKLTN